MFAPQQAEVLLAFPSFIEPSEIFIADSGKIIPGIVVGNAQGGGYSWYIADTAKHSWFSYIFHVFNIF